MSEEATQQQRDAFQAYLRGLGYEIEQDSPVFQHLFPLYQDGTLYRVAQSEFVPVFIWNPEAQALLAPYKMFR